MLHRLRVQNYALIESIEVEFASGLNILTGETGAGKSLLLGALNLAQGRRFDSSLLAQKGKKCIVELEFRFDSEPESIRQFQDSDWYEADLYKCLIIRREITSSGKSRSFINDTPVLLDELKALTEYLIELHGQHEGQQILESKNQILALDQYAGITAQVQAYETIFDEYNKLIKEVDVLKASEAESKRKADYLKYQIDEIKKADIQYGEEQLLEQELKLLHHAELLVETLGHAIHVLDRDDESINRRLIEQEKKLSKITDIHDKIQEEIVKLEQARILIEDAVSELERIGGSIEANPKRLAYLEERLSLYHKLKTKYSATSADQLIDIVKELEQNYSQLEEQEGKITKLEKKIDEIIPEITKIGFDIENERIKAASELSRKIESILAEVGLNKSEFKIEVDRIKSDGVEIEKGIKANKSGFNQVTFLIRTNPGQPVAPLSSIASGGEISRTMLALKAALVQRIKPAVLIFDEIDTGISGETALKVGYVMDRIAESNQMIVITHLPQIASRGSQHFKIYKEVIDGNTFSRIKKLTPEERINEIAVIMSGDAPTTSTLKSARELISLKKNRNA